MTGADRTPDEERHVNLTLADIVAQSISDAAEVNRAAAQAQRFPLDAEQIVRLTGCVLAQVLNAIRHPDARKIDERLVTLAIGDATGVRLPVQDEGWGRRLMAYGVKVEPTPSTAPRHGGGSHEG